MASAVISRHRRPRAGSSWDFNVETDDVYVKGTVTAPKDDDDLAFEQAGWRTIQVVQAILDAVNSPVEIEFVGLSPHPDGAQAATKATKEPPLATIAKGSAAGGTLMNEEA